ncbi:hypothetical protein [Butyrivibrio sp. NC2002]|uniref:hypothetical protein n=1 Tax=Butyrivibrio sp. NC2002 TaxID=1410610 RepID=UPI00068F2E0E|nr:hypothetical protein [Butyrivibrio sp. NC2002]
MRIQDATINLTSTRKYECRAGFFMENKTMAVKGGAEGISQFAGLVQNIQDKNTVAETEDKNGGIDTGDKLFTNYNAEGDYAIGDNSSITDKLNEIENIRKRLMERILDLMQALFGRRGGNSKVRNLMNDLSSQIQSGSYSFMSVRTATFTKTEEEHTAFSAEGKAYTEDGRELSFNVTVKMSRSFTQSMTTLNMSPATLIDPLVINVGKEVTGISDQTFVFDLDADGQTEVIRNIGKGSGFLSYDKNGDGVINDGSELFGAISGDGFSELEEFDDDHNGFIDENDSIYEKLRIWCRDEDGNDTLMTLKEGDVGAIYLGRADTQFTSQGQDLKVNGMYRQTGVYLRESTGQAGVIHQIDLAKMA